MSEASVAPRAATARPNDLAAGLQELIQSDRGAGARVQNLAEMEDGHAGQTFGFDVVGPGLGEFASYVLKIAPVGVTRRGNTDVYRQAPLLRALNAAGLPVPGVPWASPDDALLGSPFIVMERMPGRVFLIWEPHASFSLEPARVRDLWLQAARLLARFHLLDWKASLAGWEAPRPLEEEVGRWAPVLRHAQDPAWLAAGADLGARLAANLPDAQPIGLVHGDFQPGNILYQEGRAGGVIDWELASIGSQGLDLGWLLMMSDPRAWNPKCLPVAPISADDVIGAYRDAGGPAARDIEWYQALGLYKLGAISCLNVKLHRTGKRVDALWERFALSIPYLFARGAELVATDPRRPS
jgi:aminoglycoside phosphotransferase (APT) family kinase protein